MNRMHRNLSIDIFRALAIILVTSYHISIFINNPTHTFLIFDFYGPFHKGTVGVAIFVFISGYITHASSFRLPGMDFIKKRLLRVSLPYYMAILVMNLLIYFGFFSSGSHHWVDNITHLTFIHNLHPKTFFTISGVFWYVGLQVQLYILYLIIRQYVNKYYLLLGFVAFFCALAANVWLPNYFSNHSEWTGVVNKSVLSYAFLFIAGVVIKDREDLFKPILVKSFVFYGIMITSTAWLFLKRDFIGYGELDHMAIGLLLGLLMLGMPKINEDNIIVHSLVTIGTASYSIYLYNFIFWTFAPQLYFVKGLFLYTFITIAIGIAMYYLIEDPILKRIR